MNEPILRALASEEIKNHGSDFSNAGRMMRWPDSPGAKFSISPRASSRNPTRESPAAVEDAGERIKVWNALTHVLDPVRLFCEV